MRLVEPRLLCLCVLPSSRSLEGHFLASILKVTGMPRWLSNLLLSHHIPQTRKEEQEHSGPLTPLQAKPAPFLQPSPKNKTFLLTSLWLGLSPQLYLRVWDTGKQHPLARCIVTLKKNALFLLRGEETLDTRWQLAAYAFHPWKEVLILTMYIPSYLSSVLLTFWVNQFFVMVGCLYIIRCFAVSLTLPIICQ